MKADKDQVRFSGCLVGLTALLIALPAASASGAKYKVPGTKGGSITTPDGVKIHYLEAGKAAQRPRVVISQEPMGEGALVFDNTPAILFVPGWTMPAWIWEHQITHFAKSHRVVAMDPRSQGESQQTTEGHYPAARARDIKAVVDQLKLAPVVLVGWSMGTNELAAYVDQFGTETVAGLVFVDGDAGSDPEPAALKEYFNWVAGFYADRRTATETFVREMYKRPHGEDYYERVTQAALVTPTNTALALLLANVSTDNRSALATIDKPTLVLAAESPWLHYVEDVHKRIPGSQFVVMDNVGHALFADDPDQFNLLLENFLEPLRVKLPDFEVYQQK